MNMIKEMRIETDRLIIRPFIHSDLVECFEIMQDEELFKYLDWKVTSIESFKGTFEWWIDLYETDYDGDFSYNFAVFLKEDNKFIGEFDFYNGEPYYTLTKEDYMKNL